MTAAAPPESCPIYPEFSYGWIVRELTGEGVPIIRERPSNRYTCDDKVRDDRLGVADYWQGRTLSEAMLSHMSPDEMKGDFMGIMLYSTSLYHFAGVGHLVPDWGRLLDHGCAGIRQRVQEKLEGLAPGDERQACYRARLIVLDAIIDYIHRYGSLACEQAARAEGQRRDELLQMAANLEQGVSRDSIQEIIDCHAVIDSSFMKLRDWVTTQAALPCPFASSRE